MEKKLLEVLDRHMKSEPPNRHISFFQGIIPSLDNFSEDEVIPFKGELIKLMQGH